MTSTVDAAASLSVALAAASSASAAAAAAATEAAISAAIESSAGTTFGALLDGGLVAFLCAPSHFSYQIELLTRLGMRMCGLACMGSRVRRHGNIS